MTWFDILGWLVFVFVCCATVATFVTGFVLLRDLWYALNKCDKLIAEWKRRDAESEAELKLLVQDAVITTIAWGRYDRRQIDDA